MQLIAEPERNCQERRAEDHHLHDLRRIGAVDKILDGAQTSSWRGKTQTHNVARSPFSLKAGRQQPRHGDGAADAEQRLRRPGERIHHAHAPGPKRALCGAITRNNPAAESLRRAGSGRRQPRNNRRGRNRL